MRRLASAAVAVALLHSAGVAGAARHRHAPCAPPHSTTKVETNTTRVSSVRDPKGEGDLPTNVYACWKANGRKLLLASPHQSDCCAEKLKGPVFAGGDPKSPLIAWAVDGEDGVAAWSQAFAADLSQGRVVAKSPGPASGQDNSVDGFLVTPGSTLVYLSQAAGGAGKCYGVLAVHGAGPEQQIGCVQGTTLPKNLAWAGGVLYWTEGTMAKSAPVP